MVALDAKFARMSFLSGSAISGKICIEMSAKIADITGAAMQVGSIVAGGLSYALSPLTGLFATALGVHATQKSTLQKKQAKNRLQSVTQSLTFQERFYSALHQTHTAQARATRFGQYKQFIVGEAKKEFNFFKRYKNLNICFTAGASAYTAIATVKIILFGMGMGGVLSGALASAPVSATLFGLTAAGAAVMGAGSIGFLYGHPMQAQYAEREMQTAAHSGSKAHRFLRTLVKQVAHNPNLQGNQEEKLLLLTKMQEERILRHDQLTAHFQGVENLCAKAANSQNVFHHGIDSKSGDYQKIGMVKTTWYGVRKLTANMGAGLHYIGQRVIRKPVADAKQAAQKTHASISGRLAPAHLAAYMQANQGAVLEICQQDIAKRIQLLEQQQQTRTALSVHLPLEDLAQNIRNLQDQQLRGAIDGQNLSQALQAALHHLHDALDVDGIEGRLVKLKVWHGLYAVWQHHVQSMQSQLDINQNQSDQYAGNTNAERASALVQQLRGMRDMEKELLNLYVDMVFVQANEDEDDHEHDTACAHHDHHHQASINTKDENFNAIEFLATQWINPDRHFTYWQQRQLLLQNEIDAIEDEASNDTPPTNHT